MDEAALRELLAEGLAEIAAGKDTPLTREDLRAIADAAKTPPPPPDAAS
jgi:hypothetical protein